MNDKQIKHTTSYRCPVCKGEMAQKISGKQFISYLCEICEALLMVEVKHQPQEIQIGKVKIYVDNNEVADILKRGDK